MSSSTHNVLELGRSAAQAPERLLNTASLRNLEVSVEFIGIGWRETRPVIVNIDITTEAKEDRLLLLEGLRAISDPIEQRLQRSCFRSLDQLVDCIAPLALEGKDERVQIVAQTRTAVPCAKEGLTRVLIFMKRPPHEKTEHNSYWVIESQERLIRSLKVSCNIGPDSNQPNARQMFSLHIRIIGDLPQAEAPDPNTTEGADMWCRLAKRVCETAESYVYVSAGELIRSIAIFLLAEYPVPKVRVACEKLSPQSGLPFVEGEVIEIIRDRRALGAPYLGEKNALTSP